MTALLPALVLGIVSIWSGTFYGGASAAGSATTWLLVLATGYLGVPEWRDPLRLGRAGRLLPWALLVTLGASCLASPVPRAGLVALATLPAWLLLPAAVARCWRDPDDRRRGLIVLGLVVSSVALTALVHWRLSGPPRPAMPLGHHNLLAGWLVLMLPLALAPVRAPGPGRWLAAGAGGLGLAAVVASRSLMALAALALQGLLISLVSRRSRAGSLPARLLAVAGLMPLALLLWLGWPRLLELGGLRDPSLSARWVYLQAGWRGLVERPALGWGPGSVPWTVARFLHPEPGTNPASEVVGDLHSLPIQLGYEGGGTAVALVICLLLVFVGKRRRELTIAAEPDDSGLALISLAGGLVFLLGSAPLQIPALDIALAVAAGAALATSSPVGRISRLDGRRIAAYSAFVALAVVLLLPLARAHHHYEKAVTGSTLAIQRRELARARELDPAFPLYAFRSALAESHFQGPSTDDARLAREAATKAPGLAPLWLTAGRMALESGEHGAFDALLRAHRLDPLAPLPAFHLMRSKPDHPMAATWGGRALAADPRLAAAVWWEGRLDLWRSALRAVARGAPATAVALERAPPPADGQDLGDTVTLALGMDGDRTVSFSLFAFRRLPWPASLAPVRLRVRRLEALEASR